MKFTILIGLLLFTDICNAQNNGDSIYTKYSNGLVYRLGASYMMGNQKLSLRELGKEFSMSDIGLDQYNLAKRKLTTGKIFLYTSFACGLIAAAVGPKNIKLGLGFVGAQMITINLSMRSTNAGIRFLDQAIQIRNKNYLFPTK